MKNDLLSFKYYTSFKVIFPSAARRWNFTLHIYGKLWTEVLIFFVL